MSVTGQLNAAFARIGAVFGGSYQQFRPGDASNPLATQMGTITAAFDTTAMLTFRAPGLFGKPDRFAATDPSVLAVGDYLVGALGTLFVAGLEVNKPALCIQCNAVLSFSRPAGDVAPGVGTYGGATDATDVVLATGWPASALIKTRGEAGPGSLPGDDKLALFEVLVPAISGVTLRTSDLVEDAPRQTGDLPRRFVVTAAELSLLGWRLYAQLMAA